MLKGVEGVVESTVFVLEGGGKFVNNVFAGGLIGLGHLLAELFEVLGLLGESILKLGLESWVLFEELLGFW